MQYTIREIEQRDNQQIERTNRRWSRNRTASRREWRLRTAENVLFTRGKGNRDFTCLNGNRIRIRPKVLYQVLFGNAGEYGGSTKIL